MTTTSPRPSSCVSTAWRSSSPSSRVLPVSTRRARWSPVTNTQLTFTGRPTQRCRRGPIGTQPRPGLNPPARGWSESPGRRLPVGDRPGPGSPWPGTSPGQRAAGGWRPEDSGQALRRSAGWLRRSPPQKSCDAQVTPVPQPTGRPPKPTQPVKVTSPRRSRPGGADSLPRSRPGRGAHHHRESGLRLDHDISLIYHRRVGRSGQTDHATCWRSLGCIEKDTWKGRAPGGPADAIGGGSGALTRRASPEAFVVAGAAA